MSVTVLETIITLLLHRQHNVQIADRTRKRVTETSLIRPSLWMNGSARYYAYTPCPEKKEATSFLGMITLTNLSAVS